MRYEIGLFASASVEKLLLGEPLLETLLLG